MCLEELAGDAVRITPPHEDSASSRDKVLIVPSEPAIRNKTNIGGHQLFCMCLTHESRLHEYSSPWIVCSWVPNKLKPPPPRQLPVNIRCAADDVGVAVQRPSGELLCPVCTIT